MNEQRLRAIQQRKRAAEPSRSSPLGFSARMAAMQVRGCAVVGQVTREEMLDLEHALLQAAEQVSPNSKFATKLHQAFWRGGFAGGDPERNNDLARRVFEGDCSFPRPETMTHSATPKKLRATVNDLRRWPPPAKSSWFSGYTQGMEAVRLMRLGADAPLFSLDVSMAFVTLDFCREACARRVDGWSYFFTKHFSRLLEQAADQKRWREGAADAVLAHAKSCMRGEFAARVHEAPGHRHHHNNQLQWLDTLVKAAGVELSRAVAVMSLAIGHDAPSGAPSGAPALPASGGFVNLTGAVVPSALCGQSWRFAHPQCRRGCSAARREDLGFPARPLRGLSQSKKRLVILDGPLIGPWRDQMPEGA